MPAPATTLDKLVALSREPACGRRRQLLHALTDPLFAAPPQDHKRVEALLPLMAEELAAAEFARRTRLRGRMNRDLLYLLLRDGETARATHCFGEITEIGYEAAHGVFADPSNELLALICKAQGWPRDQFIILALLRDHRCALTVEAAAAAAALFDRIPLDAAERAIRFWRLRRRALDIEAEGISGGLAQTRAA